MTKRLLLLMAMTVVLSSAAPTFATNWGGNWGGGDWGNHDWGNHDWGNDWWPKDDKPKDEYECKWDEWFDSWDDIVWTRRWDNDNSKLLGDRNWWKNDNNNKNWPSRDEIKEWLEHHEWKKDGYHSGKWHCKPHEDPIPEPATAGLALMGMGALIAATRRRRK